MPTLDGDLTVRRVSETKRADDLLTVARYYGQESFTERLQAFFKTNDSIGIEVRNDANGFKIGDIITQIKPDYLKRIEIIPVSGVVGPNIIPEFHVKIILENGKFIYFHCWYNMGSSSCINQIMEKLISPLNTDMLREKVFIKGEQESFLKSTEGLPLVSIFEKLFEVAQKVCPEFFSGLKDPNTYKSMAFSACHEADPGFAH